MNSPMMIWLNDGILPLHEARLSPLDHGFLVGDGVFETLAIRDGVPFAGHEHYVRLRHSCEATGIACISEELYTQSLFQVAEANGLTEARVRITLTSGDGPLGSERGSGVGTMLVVATPLKPWPPTERVWLAPWTRNTQGALAGVKSVSYGENVRALLYAKERGAGEALVGNERGMLCEGTGSNVFVVWQGRLITPPLSSGCLAGITRALTLQACATAGIPYEEVDVPVAVLDACEEAFLTSSTRDVHPISQINDRHLSAPGPVTEKVQKAWANLFGQTSR
jgi:branched-chain amino acid aminotransferase